MATSVNPVFFKSHQLMPKAVGTMDTEKLNKLEEILKFNKPAPQFNSTDDQSTEPGQPDRPRLIIVKQPSIRHRARYKTEMSRGLIKDRSGDGFPTLKLVGVKAGKIKIRCFIGDDKKRGNPHLFYEISLLKRKNSVPASIKNIDGVQVIEMELDMMKDEELACNCIGIVKQRVADVQLKLARHHLLNVSKDHVKLKALASCCMVFSCHVPGYGDVNAISEPIICKPTFGGPKIIKVSCSEADVNDDGELFIFGQNFNKQSKVIWTDEKSSWTKVVDPNPNYIHTSHLICSIPRYQVPIHDENRAHTVKFYVKCGDEMSKPFEFTYTRD